MFKITIFALATAGALIVSGCATSAWKPAAGHPADPGAQSGVTSLMTSLSRYRGQTPPAPTAPAETEEMDHSQHDMDEMEEEK